MAKRTILWKNSVITTQNKSYSMTNASPSMKLQSCHFADYLTTRWPRVNLTSLLSPLHFSFANTAAFISDLVLDLLLLLPFFIPYFFLLPLASSPRVRCNEALMTAAMAGKKQASKGKGKQTQEPRSPTPREQEQVSAPRQIFLDL